jgi:hypothetical protein
LHFKHRFTAHHKLSTNLAIVSELVITSSLFLMSLEPVFKMQ